jgi:hypothetical protein
MFSGSSDHREGDLLRMQSMRERSDDDAKIDKK